MAHILKVIRGVVQTLSVIISIAFLLNSVSGALGAIQLADGYNIRTDNIKSKDFTINYSNLSIDVGLNITNPGIYSIENVKVGIKFEIRRGSEDWIALLDNNSVDMGDAESPQGDTILSGEHQRIGLTAKLEDFKYSSTQIQQMFLLPPLWDLKDLIKLSDPNLKFETRLILKFTIWYAFGQYKLDLTITLDNQALEVGF